MKARSKAAAFMPQFEKLGIFIESYNSNICMRMSETESRKFVQELESGKMSNESQLAQIRARIAIAYDRPTVKKLYEEAMALMA